MSHRRRHQLASVSSSLLLCAASLAFASPANSEMTIERGDILHVFVAEAPKFTGDRRVDGDGKIMLPQLGGVAVAGVGLDEARTRLEQELVKRDILKSPSIVVEIAKYRPFYVGGKVRRPGSVDFEPGLTVRHALILAGGVGTAQDSNLTDADIPGLRAKWQTTTFALLQTNSQIARLTAELTRSEQANLSVPGNASADAKALVSIDQSILGDRIKTWSESQSRLRDGMALLDLEIDVLGQQAQLQETERETTNDQVEVTKSLVAKGIMPLPRLQELQHVASRASMDLLENQAFAARARQSRSNVQHDLNTAELQWRISIGQQMREATIARNKLKAELDAISSQIIDANQDWAEDATPQQTVVFIYRRTDGTETKIRAQMSTEIFPGDILDVSISVGSGGSVP